MNSPTVSVVIPAYSNAEYLGEAIESVLAQTYPYFEILVVNDASPDNTQEVVQRFDDPRIKYIVHGENRGLSAARNTGIRASSGAVIALLDGDDLYHPKKLQSHIEFLEKHHDVGVTYNARFELNHSSKTIRDLWRPPVSVTLTDLVFGFPFGPSDMVLRREWVFRVNLFDEYHVYVGEDLDINCRLALAGCKFASVDRALNYRRYHSGRIVKDLRRSVEDTIRPLNSVFSDPRCPEDVLALREKATAKHYLLWSAIAFAQDDTDLGREYCLAAVRRDPSFVKDEPSLLVEAMLACSIVDDSLNHVALLHRMLDQLPEELAWQADQCDWAVARGYLLKAARAVVWGRAEAGNKYFEQAAKLKTKIDDPFLGQLTKQLIDYEREYGMEAAGNVLQALLPHLAAIGGSTIVRQLNASYSINRAFQNYRLGEYSNVPPTVMRAIASDPRYLANRGVLAILFRSLKSSLRTGLA